MSSTFATEVEPRDPVVPEPSGSMVASRTLTGLIVIGPVVALAVLVPILWGAVVSVRDVVIGLVLYLLSGFGVTVGYHRLFAHRSFTAKRGLKIVLAAAGSMAVEGSVASWVANHRRHHRFSDRPGDPHSPHDSTRGEHGRLRGLAHAHVGWLFADETTSTEHYAADITADPDLARMSSLWGVFAIGSLVAPFALGWILSGTLTGAVTTFLWAGVVRMLLLHHVTWSINSICHVFGTQPFRTRDESRNVAALAVISMGESFHNLHHAYPSSARHGALPHQHDPSAALIHLFERVGWATDVNWPTPMRVAGLRRGAGAPTVDHRT